MAGCRIRERKKVRPSTNCMFLGFMMILWDRVCEVGSVMQKGCGLVELLVVLTCLRGRGITGAGGDQEKHRIPFKQL